MTAHSRDRQALQHAGNANKKLTGIEANTACKIEMSNTKDQSLTFFITGKQPNVLKAKRMILVDFQTQANKNTF